MKAFMTIDDKTIASSNIKEVSIRASQQDEQSILEVKMFDGSNAIVLKDTFYIVELFNLINENLDSDDLTGFAYQLIDIKYGSDK